MTLKNLSRSWGAFINTVKCFSLKKNGNGSLFKQNKGLLLEKAILDAKDIKGNSRDPRAP